MEHTASKTDQLLVIYNADSGLLNMIAHALHKSFAPATYPCSLCATTYGPVSMRKEWKQFLAALPIEPVFLHRDEFEQQYPGKMPALPAIMKDDANGDLDELLTAVELDNLKYDLDGLMSLLGDRLGYHKHDYALA